MRRPAPAKTMQPLAEEIGRGQEEVSAAHRRVQHAEIQQVFQEVALAPRPTGRGQLAVHERTDRLPNDLADDCVRRVVRTGDLPPGPVADEHQQPVILFAAPEQLALRQAFVDRAEEANVGRAIIEEDEPPAGRVAASGQGVDGRGQEAIGARKARGAFPFRATGLRGRATGGAAPGDCPVPSGKQAREPAPKAIAARGVGGRQCAGRGGAGRSPPPRRFAERACPARSRDRPPRRRAQNSGPRPTARPAADIGFRG